MRVAVTGGSGKIGSVVVRRLIERGHSVINIDRKTPPDARTAKARFVYADLRDRQVIQPIFEQVDAVCHLGEIAGLHGPDGPDHVYAHNTAVGACVLQTAADLRLSRVIYTSTAQVYGCWGGPLAPPVRLPMDETHPLNPRNAYALSKACNEHYARILGEEQRLSVASFRFPWVVTEPPGERWMPHIDSNDGPMEGMGTYLFVEDAAEAYVLALERPAAGFQAYHFVAEDVWSGVPLKQRLARHHAGYPALPDDWPDYRAPVDCGKALADFGWRPQFRVQDLLGEWRARRGAGDETPAAPAGGKVSRTRLSGHIQ